MLGSMYIFDLKYLIHSPSMYISNLKYLIHSPSKSYVRFYVYIRFKGGGGGSALIFVRTQF